MSQAVESIVTSQVGQAPYPARAVAWYATVMLAFLYWLSVLDRFIISLLVGPIKSDLGITDVQFGLLQGFAFALTFAAFGLVFGAIADRYNRRLVIFAGVFIWSLATAACGVAQNFVQMALARVGVGAGEAALNPCATSMLTDLFPRERLTMAMAVYAMGATVGAGCAFAFGGWLVGLVSQTSTVLLPVVGEVRSWQAVFFIVGLPGALLSLLVLTIPEPLRRGRHLSQAQGTRRGPYWELLKFIRARRRFFICHYAGFTFASIIVSGAGAWYPAHMMRSFGWSPAQIGLALGVTLAGAGVIGKVICGQAVDRLYRHGWRDAQIRWYAACLLVGTPIGVFAFTSSNPWLFLGGLGLFLVLASPLPACAATALNLVTPNELRGAGVAVFAMIGGILGAGGGPVLIAAVAEHVFKSEAAIGLAMATVLGVCCPLGALSLALGFRAMRAAATDAERWDQQ